MSQALISYTETSNSEKLSLHCAIKTNLIINIGEVGRQF